MKITLLILSKCRGDGTWQFKFRPFKFLKKIFKRLYLKSSIYAKKQ